MDEKYTELAIKMEGVDSRCKSNTYRIEDCEEEIKEIKNEQKAIYKIANSVENLATSMSGLQNDVKEIKTGQEKLNDKVITLENTPAQTTKRRWDSISDKLLWLLVGGVATFILAQILPNIF